MRIDSKCEEKGSFKGVRSREHLSYYYYYSLKWESSLVKFENLIPSGELVKSIEKEKYSKVSRREFTDFLNSMDLEFI